MSESTNKGKNINQVESDPEIFDDIRPVKTKMMRMQGAAYGSIVLGVIVYIIKSILCGCV